MSENRAYAGPHDAAELLVDDSRYVLVVRSDLTDEQVREHGYELDGDEAIRLGKPLAVRTITVSDVMGEKLDVAGFNDPDEPEAWVQSWPKVGGTPAEQTVDVPELHPSLRDVELESGEVITSSEADRRARLAADTEEVVERASVIDAEAAAAEEALALRVERMAQIDERAADLKRVALDELDEPDRKTITDELAELERERKAIEKAHIDAEKGR